MKRFLTLFILFCSISSFSQDYFKNGYGETRHSIGLFVSPIEFVYWNKMPYSELWSNGPQRLYIQPFYPIGINYQYEINYLFKLNVSGYLNKESFLYNENIDNTHLYIDYKVTYLKIPLGIRFYPGHFAKEDAIGGFFLQANGNLDVVTSENIYTSSSGFADPRFPGPPGVNPTSPQTISEAHSNQLRLHKICPSICIGHEIVLERMSFYYGARLEMQAVHQNKNIQEDYKNRSFSLINIGLNYRF